jgi:hypothetical protein
MRKTHVLTLALALATNLSQAQNAQLELAEVGETITATLNGTISVPLTVSGTIDNWTIKLPPGYTMPNISGYLLLAEPEDADAYNYIVLDGRDLTFNWSSELTPRPAAGVVTSPFTFQNFGSLPSGAPYDLTFADLPGPATAPESAPTLVLLGMAVIGLLVLARGRCMRLTRVDGSAASSVDCRPDFLAA